MTLPIENAQKANFGIARAVARYLIGLAVIWGIAAIGNLIPGERSNDPTIGLNIAFVSYCLAFGLVGTTLFAPGVLAAICIWARPVILIRKTGTKGWFWLAGSMVLAGANIFFIEAKGELLWMLGPILGVAVPLIAGTLVDVICTLALSAWKRRIRSEKNPNRVRLTPRRLAARLLHREQ